jgi:hypothetical protein
MEINNMNKYLIKHKKGVSIMHLIKGDIEIEILKWAENTGNDIINYRLIKDDDIPIDREFRNAWDDITEESKIDISGEKVKELLLKELRDKRNTEFEKLDKDFIIALDRDDKNKLIEIKSKKEELRKITDPLKNEVVKEVLSAEDIIKLKGLIGK